MTSPNRRIIALAGLLIEIVFGAIYAWSVFSIPLSTAFGWSISPVTLTFKIAILVLGFGSFLGGFRLACSTIGYIRCVQLSSERDTIDEIPLFRQVLRSSFGPRWPSVSKQLSSFNLQRLMPASAEGALISDQPRDYWRSPPSASRQRKCIRSSRISTEMRGQKHVARSLRKI